MLGQCLEMGLLERKVVKGQMLKGRRRSVGRGGSFLEGLIGGRLMRGTEMVGRCGCGCDCVLECGSGWLERLVVGGVLTVGGRGDGPRFGRGEVVGGVRRRSQVFGMVVPLGVGSSGLVGP